MAYGRYSRRSRFVRRRRPGTRSIRRTARRTTTRYRRTRSTRPTTRRPRLLTRRGINDLTSKKKRDNMLTWSNITVPRTPVPPITGTAAVLQGGGAYYNILWSPTIREKQINSSSSPTVEDESTRTSSTTYAKGLRERLSIQTNSAVPWTWRRIVFTMKGTASYLPNFPLTTLTSNGYARTLSELTSGQATVIQNLVFDGSFNLDWRDPLDAKVDIQLITLLSDRTMIITPQTSSGAVKNFTRYYPFEKNLIYAEDEFGGQTTDSGYAALGKQGMGDVLIYDIFAPRGGAAFGDQMTVDIQSTYYWHEK